VGLGVNVDERRLRDGEVDVVERCEAQAWDAPVLGLEVHGALVSKEVHRVKGKRQIIGLASWAVAGSICAY
jgi:hypothetical protein